MKKIINEIKYFLNGISNFWKFRKEIYNWQCWDFGFTEDILRKCLEEKLKYFEKEDKEGFWDVKKPVKTLRIAVTILNRRHKGQYYGKGMVYSEMRDWNIFCSILDNHFESWWI